MKVSEWISNEPDTIIAADNLKEALWEARGRPPKDGLCPCPPGCANEHDDSNPSFAVRTIENKLLFKCFSSCDQQEALQALIDNGWWKASEDGEWDTAYEDMARASGIGLAMDGENYWENDLAATHNYKYFDEAGKPIAIHLRWDREDGTKSMSWKLPTEGASHGLDGLKMEQIPLYGLEQLINQPDAPVFFVEGEKAAEACWEQGLVAVTNAGGSGQKKFGSSLDPLMGRKIYLWADNDAVGRKFMINLKSELRKITSDVNEIHVNVPYKGDAYDYFATGGDIDGLLKRSEPVLIHLEHDKYRVELPTISGILQLEFSGVIPQRGAVQADATITVDNENFRTRLNLMSTSARQAWIREAKQVFSGFEIDWAPTLNKAIGMVTQAVFVDDTLSDQAEAEEPPEYRFLVQETIPEGSVSLWFGDGSSLKTTSLLQLSTCVAYGHPWAGRETVPTKMMLLDYENDENNFVRYTRRMQDALGIVPQKGRMFYENARGVALNDLVERLRMYIERHGIGFIVIDSGALACGGKPEEAESALTFFNALARLGDDITVVVICHITKSALSTPAMKREATKKPFGSTFWHSSARATFFIERDELTKEQFAVKFKNRKTNISAPLDDFALEVTFDDPDGGIYLSPMDFSQVKLMQEQSKEKKSRKDEILGLLQDTQMSLNDIASILEVETDTKKVKSLRSQLNRFERDGLIMKTEEGWTLA
tara:strand:- start:1600 stop:3735 length:2136 start_codon:yes stop_codon:yes gene_type:complete